MSTIPKTVRVSIELGDHLLPEGEWFATQSFDLDIQLSATIMHDNMLNVQRAVDQGIYELFRRLHNDTVGGSPQSS